MIVRISILWFVISLLVGCASSPMPPSEPIVTSQVKVQSTPAPIVVPPAQEEPAAGVEITPLQTPDEVAITEPHIALLLPLNSRDFARVSDVVKEGFQAAAKFQTGNPPIVKIYPLNNENEDLLNAYQKAVKLGARCIVGGLTRDGAATMATVSGNKLVPTLSLNEVDPTLMLPNNFYTISLSLDDEARQLAQFMINEGFSNISILVGPSTLSKRVRTAFDQAYMRLGGKASIKLPLNKDSAEYSKYRGYVQDTEAILIIAESPLARQVIPYVGKTLPIFATSQVYDGKSAVGVNVDLQGIRFLDMPWLVDPLHVAVAVYPHNQKAVNAELERLYALGIDAYRLSEIMTTKIVQNPVWLDGVTGTISLRDGHRFRRELMPAYFDNQQISPLKPSDNEQ